MTQARIVDLSTPICDFLDALVHPSAREDALTAERHLAFMVPRLFASLIALGALPVFLAVRGAPSALEFFVLAWMIVPIATACFLSRTGRYESAQGLSAFALTGMVTIVAAYSGGMNSFAAIWFVLIPLEAALSGSRRVVLVAALLAIGGTGLLILSGFWLDGLGAERSSDAVAVLGILSAVLYSTGIALGADSLIRANVMRRCRRSDEDIGRDGDPTNPHVIAVMRDVTVRKTRQDALIAVRAEAERANTARSRFLTINPGAKACVKHRS